LLLFTTAQKGWNYIAPNPRYSGGIEAVKALGGSFKLVTVGHHR